MDIEKLREDLIIDEGTKDEIYLDHLGLPTFGIGHLVTEWDEEYGKPVGTPVSQERVKQCFQMDVQGTISECKVLFDDFDELPEEVKQIIGNLMFNMGRPRLSKFVKFREAISKSDWLECAIQMEDSRWHKQVTKRADRLIKRMEDLGVKEQVA